MVKGEWGKAESAKGGGGLRTGESWIERTEAWAIAIGKRKLDFLLFYNFQSSYYSESLFQ